MYNLMFSRVNVRNCVQSQVTVGGAHNALRCVTEVAVYYMLKAALTKLRWW